MIGTWENNSDGVMLFVPRKVSNQAEDSPRFESLMSGMSISQEPQSAAVDKSSPERPPLASPPVSHSPSGEQTPVIYTPTSSDAGSCQLQFNWVDSFRQQLAQFANEGEDEHNHFEQDTPESSNLSSRSGYASSRTDFLDDTETPCPRRSIHNGFQGSTAVKLPAGQKRGPSVIRCLTFGQAATNKIPKHAPIKSKGESLRSIEYLPRHNWTRDQRRLLCILWRFYERVPEDFAEIFNTMAGTNLSTRKVKYQYESYIRLHGEKAFPFYGEINKIPLQDPKGICRSTRIVIEHTARRLNIELFERRNDSSESSGRAAKARSKITRRRFKALVRKARLETSEGHSFDIGPFKAGPKERRIRLGGFALRITNMEEYEVYADVDGQTTLQEISPQEASSQEASPQETWSSHPYQPCHLAYRVWDANSRTVFDAEVGFVAEAHSIWNGSLLPPPNPKTTDGRNAMLFLANLHLNKKGNASAFVSVATSLIQVLNYASNMTNPMIAVIDLSHPSLHEPYKQLKASSCLKELKAIGQAQWARYRGLAEIMIWANIERDAVMHQGRLSDITAALAGDTAQLFDPEAFHPHQKVSSLTKKIKALNITLNCSVARSMGDLGKALGLSHCDVRLEHISDFVQVLIDGWSVQFTQYDDIHTRTSIATSFALALGSRSSKYLLQDILEAFVVGLERGMKNLAHYNRRSGLQRRRTA